MPVVAIGGSASVGKTTCAARVAELLGLDEVLHVDELSKQTQANVAPHAFDVIERPWQQPPEYLVQQLIDWTRRLHPLIVEAVEKLAPTGGVLEGEGIDPRLAGGFAADVSSVYVIESNPKRLRATFETRPSGTNFASLTSSEKRTVVEMNRLYAQWLRTAAEEIGQPSVRSQPWRTLPDRILAAIN